MPNLRERMREILDKLWALGHSRAIRSFQDDDVDQALTALADVMGEVVPEEKQYCVIGGRYERWRVFGHNACRTETLRRLGE